MVSRVGFQQLCSLAILVFALCCSSQSHFDKVLLQNVDTIVLREGQTTNARRVSPIPQLRCVGGSAGCTATPRPNLVICTNVGTQRQDVRWDCEADFDNKYKFGRLQVSCEGYDHPEDPYVLKDSCGLEYEIDYEYSHQQSYGYSSDQQSGWLSFTNILFFAAIGILVYAIYKNSLDVGATGATPAPAAPAAATGTGTGTSGFWGNFMSGMFVGGIANFLFSTVSSLFRPNPYGYRPGYGHRGGMSGWGGGRRGYHGGGGFGTGGGFSSGGFGSGGGGGTSRKSGFGGTTKR